MTERPGGFRHQHGDPRGLRERIDAQLRERIEEALEVAALELLVELRKKAARPAPDGDSRQDREAWEALAADVLMTLRESLHGALDPTDRGALEAAEAAGGRDPRERALAGQVALAKRLPDYWQRLDGHRQAYRERRLAEPTPVPGWRRLLGS